MQGFLLAFCLLLLAAQSGLAGAVSAPVGLPKYIDEYTVPIAHAAPLAITVDLHGIVWFTLPYISFSGFVDGTVRGDVRASGTAKPGNYTVGFGIDAGSVAVWSMVQIQVVTPSSKPSAQASLIFILLARLLLAGFALTFSLRRTRKHQHNAAQFLPWLDLIFRV